MVHLRTGQICSICHKGKLALLNQSDSGAQYQCDNCKGYHADFFGHLGLSASASKLDARSGQVVKKRPPKVGSYPKKELEHINRADSQIRYLFDRSDPRTAVFQIAYTPDSRIKHIDCKMCGNKWYLASRKNVNRNFAIDGDSLRCLHCGRQTTMSSV